MSRIAIKDLTFSYEGSYENIFEDVTLDLDTDWRLGFVGRNGRGKTTFLNLLRGKYAYQGSISAKIRFDYFPYDVADDSKMTIELLEGGFELWELCRELSLLSVDEEVLWRPFSTLSGGERTKVLLASLFLRENRFLLIDEPTNHLDMEGRKILARYLKNKSGFILVSHDRTFLDVCVDHILSINRNSIEVTQGDFSTWYNNKELRDQYEMDENQRLKKDIKRLTETAREKAQWSDRTEASKIGTHQADRGYVGHQAAKMMKRSKAIEKRIDREITERKELLKNVEEAESLKLHPLTFHSKLLVEGKALSLFYGDRQIFGSLSFKLEQGERLAFRGKNGCGKSSLLKRICGQDIACGGSLFVAQGLKISYVSQDTSTLSGSLEEFEAEHCLNVPLFRAILRKLDFSRTQFEKRIDDYSQGQKKKVLIARSLCEEAHLYIWDEPLNYIDLLSRMQIEDLLLTFRPTLVFVEHDAAFCEKIATGIIDIS